MKRHGFVKVCAAVPDLKLADIEFNKENIIRFIKRAEEDNADVVVFPELCVTGYTCGDLFNHPDFIARAEAAAVKIKDFTLGKQILCAIGVPFLSGCSVFNCALLVGNGRFLGIVPKLNIPNYGEFYERRWFVPGYDLKGAEISYGGELVPNLSNRILQFDDIRIGVEICEDLWVPVPPSSFLASEGADIILNLSASPTHVGKTDYVRSLVSHQSARCRCGYVYSSAGWGESSTDLVFGGHALIAENGVIAPYEEDFFRHNLFASAEIDVEKLRNDRIKCSTFVCSRDTAKRAEISDSGLVRKESCEFDIEVDPHPFVPSDSKHLSERCEEIINIQARGLIHRLNAIGCNKVVIGISGGLDSTLALLVAVRAFDRNGLSRKGIIGITMPGLATTSRTKNNATALMDELGVTAVEIPIGKAVEQHFRDINQNPELYDVTFENSQARERTQILMDYANKMNAIVVGTGDLSELALGWCTYNGDHMSMYGVNASVPKTLVRHLVKWVAQEAGGKVAEILLDIVDTPISPELVPSGCDAITQITENVVGPYELHDFFIYHFLRNSFSPEKTMFLAKKAFGGKYDSFTIWKWLKNFYRRFFNQQFKRSCMPDGPKVGSVCLSPRGDWRMPSDASAGCWLDAVEKINPMCDKTCGQ